MKSRILYLVISFVGFYLTGLFCSYFINDQVSWIYALVFAIFAIFLEPFVNKLIKKFIPSLNKQNEK